MLDSSLVLFRGMLCYKFCIVEKSFIFQKKEKLNFSKIKDYCLIEIIGSRSVF